ncbi:MAG: hypothetical protein JST59_02135 [Actinobacteria bacterium]|nr:hypothetical protein [Actinomycetota bacterium]
MHYHFTRREGLYLEDGLNFAVDFVGYSKKPESYDQHRHSLFCILVDDGSLTWSTLQKYVKVAHNMNKTLLIAKVTADPAALEHYFLQELWEKSPPPI